MQDLAPSPRSCSRHAGEGPKVPAPGNTWQTEVTGDQDGETRAEFVRIWPVPALMPPWHNSERRGRGIPATSVADVPAPRLALEAAWKGSLLRRRHQRQPAAINTDPRSRPSLFACSSSRPSLPRNDRCSVRARGGGVGRCGVADSFGGRSAGGGWRPWSAHRLASTSRAADRRSGVPRCAERAAAHPLDAGRNGLSAVGRRRQRRVSKHRWLPAVSGAVQSAAVAAARRS
jgi:hypothetical protein